MPNASNALLQVEFAQTPVPMMELTDSGDHQTFKSGQKYWSAAPGYEPVVLPNGVRSGGKVTVEGTNNKVLVAEVEVNLNGVVTTVAGDDLTVARPADTKVKKSSVTVTDAGVLAMLAGADGDSFSDVRGANGGPPLIGVDDIEIAQVWFNDDANAIVLESEIHQVPNLHEEMASFPSPQIDTYLGSVTFVDALPAIHTGSVAKKTFAAFATPVFVKVDDADAVQPPQESFSINSTTTYDGARASSTKSINAGSFTVLLQDGIIDPIMRVLGQKLWQRFYPNKNITSRYQVWQGEIGATETYPSGAPISATFSITSERPAIKVGA